MDGSWVPLNPGGPAEEPLKKKLPPRSSAPGSPVVAAPARHWKSPVGLTPALQVPHVVERGTQSATHSKTFPTMSKAPRVDTQLLREPVGTTANALFVLQSLVPLSEKRDRLAPARSCERSRLPR